MFGIVFVCAYVYRNYLFVLNVVVVVVIVGGGGGAGGGGDGGGGGGGLPFCLGIN